MGLWSSIKKGIGKVTGLFSNNAKVTAAALSGNPVAIGASTIDWLNSFGNIASSAAPYIGGYFTGEQAIKANKEAQERQYQYQSQLQQQQQQWLEQMSSSAHQREVEDLRKSGLNPILSAGGQGASTPASGMGQIGLTDDGQQKMAAISSALQFKQYQMAMKNLNSEIDKRNAEIAAISENASLTEQQKINTIIQNSKLPRKLEAEIKNIQGQTLLNLSAASAKQSEIQLMKTQMDVNKASAKYTDERDRGYSVKSPDWYQRIIKKWLNIDII